MILINIAGGVAFILFGIRFLHKGVQRLFGHGLENALRKATQHRLRAFFAGVAVAALAPTSTGVAVLSIHLMTAANLSAQNMLGIILGANIGITAAVQLIAFKMNQFAPALVLAGVALFQLFRIKALRGLGQCLLSLGIIFSGMSLIGKGAVMIDPEGDVVAILRILEHYPVTLVAACAIMTILLQSTTAVIGLGIGLSLSGNDFMSVQTMVPIVLGADLGIAFTNLAVGSGTLEGRRLGAANLTFKGIVVILCLLFFAKLCLLVEKTPGDLARQAANLHTGFNIAVAVMALPLVGPVSRLYTKLIRKGRDANGNGLAMPDTFLDQRVLHNPWLAIVNATRETLVMVDALKTMLDNYWVAFKNNDHTLAREIQESDDRIDELNKALKLYLSQIGEEGLDPDLGSLHLNLLNLSSELEAAGDLIEKNLCDTLIEHGDEFALNDPRDNADLETLFTMVRQRLDLAISILATRDRDLAGKFVEEKKRFNDWCRRARINHYERLREAENPSAEASSHFQDTMNNLRMINHHLTSIGYAFANPKTPFPSLRTPPEKPARGCGCTKSKNAPSTSS